MNLLLQYVSKLADAGNYDLHKKPLLEAATKKMMAKSMPTTKDIMLLVSLLRKSRLAIERSRHKQAGAPPLNNREYTIGQPARTGSCWEGQLHISFLVLPLLFLELVFIRRPGVRPPAHTETSTYTSPTGIFGNTACCN